MIKVLAINGSPRKNGNTSILLNYALESIKNELKDEVEVELLQTYNLKLEGCNACGSCFRNADMRCIIKDDMNEIIAKMVGADAIIMGSPTYFAEVSSEIKAIIDRSGYVAIANGRALSRKIGAGVIAVRRAGSIKALDTINNFYLINDMVIPGSTYWNIAVGRDAGDVHKDEEGVATIKRLGVNIAWLLKSLVKS